MVAYRFEDSRGGECVEWHLVGFTGTLQVDGYAAYHQFAKSPGANEGVTLAVLCPRQETVLRTSRERELAPGDPHRHHHGRTVGDRGRHPRPGS